MSKSPHIFCDCDDCVKRDMIVVKLKEWVKNKDILLTNIQVQEILKGEEQVRTDGDRELGMEY